MDRSTRSKVLAVVVAVAALFAMLGSSCNTSNDQQNRYSDDQGKAALGKWGNPAVTNFTEYKMAKEVAELRDRADLVMFGYLQGNDGALRCFGKVVGYGLPYGTQITPPNSPSGDPIREPNALFMPASAEATWVRMIDPASGKTVVVYVEPRLLISPIELPCKPLNE